MFSRDTPAERGFSLECGDSFAALVFFGLQANKGKSKNQSGEGIAALQTETALRWRIAAKLSP